MGGSGSGVEKFGTSRIRNTGSNKICGAVNNTEIRKVPTAGLPVLGIGWYEVITLTTVPLRSVNLNFKQKNFVLHVNTYGAQVPHADSSMKINQKQIFF